MKKLSLTPIAVAAINITEIICLHSFYTLSLWIGYGAYKID